MKSLTVGFLNALNFAEIKPIFLIEVTFGATTYNWASTSFDVAWDSKTWEGNGFLKSIRPANESQDLTYSGMSITLAGNLPALISLLLTNSKVSNTIKFYFGVLDAINNVVENPLLSFEGFLDKVKLSSNSQTGEIILNYENELSLLKKVIDYRFNSGTQNIFYSSDIGFEYVPQIVNGVNSFWGKTKAVKKVTSKSKGK